MIFMQQNETILIHTLTGKTLSLCIFAVNLKTK